MRIPTAYLAYRCPECGGDHCGNDATSGWDVVRQEPCLNSEYDNQWCNDCGEITLVEYTITDSVEIARIDAQRAKLRIEAEAQAMLTELRQLENDWGEIFDADGDEGHMDGGDCCEWLCGFIERARAIIARIDGAPQS